MNPESGRGGADTNLLIFAVALVIVAFGLYGAAKDVRRLEQRARRERGRALELEERLAVREGQLDGALAHIAETREPPTEDE